MSSNVRRDDRDLEGKLARPAAGQVGVSVDAIYVGCGRIRVKRATLEELDQEPAVDPTALEATDLTSFKLVCHPCEGATWWNVVAVLSGLLERGESVSATFSGAENCSGGGQGPSLRKNVILSTETTPRKM